jgi:hypothetical protein
LGHFRQKPAYFRSQQRPRAFTIFHRSPRDAGKAQHTLPVSLHFSQPAQNRSAGLLAGCPEGHPALRGFTVVATILVCRRQWSGLVVAGVNSLIVCVIGAHTSQFGFIPANVSCICIYAFNLKSWLKKGEAVTARTQIRVGEE